MLINIFRWIESVWEVYGQDNNKNWFIYAIVTPREAASRTPNKPSVTWSTRPVISQSDTLSTCLHWPPPTLPPTRSWHQSLGGNSFWLMSKNSSRTPGSGETMFMLKIGPFIFPRYYSDIHNIVIGVYFLLGMLYENIVLNFQELFLGNKCN